MCKEFSIDGEFSIKFQLFPDVVYVKGVAYARPKVALHEDHKCGICAGANMSPWYYDALQEFMGALPFERCTCEEDMAEQAGDTMLVRTLST